MNHIENSITTTKDLDLNERDEEGRTAFMLAIMKNRLDIAELLYKRGADINLQNENVVNGNRQAPIHIATRHGNTEVLNFLLLRNADTEIKNQLGGTPLMSAVIQGNTKAAKKLIEHGANVDAQSDNGRTPLMEAAMKSTGNWRFTDIVRLLLERGANPNITDSMGRTAIDLVRGSTIGSNEQRQAVIEVFETAEREKLAREREKPKSEARYVGQVVVKKNLPDSFGRVIGEYLTGPVRQRGGKTKRRKHARRTRRVRV